MILGAKDSESPPKVLPRVSTYTPTHLDQQDIPTTYAKAGSSKAMRQCSITLSWNVEKGPIKAAPRYLRLTPCILLLMLVHVTFSLRILNWHSTTFVLTYHSSSDASLALISFKDSFPHPSLERLNTLLFLHVLCHRISDVWSGFSYVENFLPQAFARPWRHFTMNNLCIFTESVVVQSTSSRTEHCSSCFTLELGCTPQS